MVAYVVPAPQAELTSTDLRRFLIQRLPDYMVPAAFVVLPALPLTAHGKLDYRALPSPGRERPNIAAGFDQAATPAEAALAEIWAEALGLESVGVEDNFFELGGDSIRSIRVISLACARGFELSVAQLFANPTIRELARTLVPTESAFSHTLPFALLSPRDQTNLPSAISDAYPLTRLQAGMLFHSSYVPSSATYHDIFSSHVAGPFRPAPMQQALDEMIAAHDILRTSFELTSYSEPLQLVHRTAGCQIECFDVSEMTPADQDNEIAACVEAEKHRGFNWSVPPLLRILAHTRGDRSFQLTLSFHHAIFDGWSVASFARELFRRYLDLQQLSPGSPPMIPACRFADHVALEQRALQSADLKAFWSDQIRTADRCELAGDDTLAHSADKPRKVKSCPVDLSPSVVERLSGLARQWGIPLKTVLLAAHLKFVSYITGREEVVTGYITNTRPEQPGGDEVLGLFLNTVPFRARLAAMAWSDLVLQTFAAERDILFHRRYPAVQIQLDVDATRLFDTAFNFVHYHLYDAFSGSVEVLGGLAYEETNLTLISEFQVQPGSGNLFLRLSYDVAVIDEAAITAYAGYFSRILRAISEDPLAAHQLASFLPDEEAGPSPAASVGPVSLELPCSAIEARAAESPDAPALFCGGKPVSYRELNARVNQIARHLRVRGVGPETRLAVSMEPLADGITTLLAALKCGAAIAPLESALPYDYLASLLLDLRPAWILAGPGVPEGLPVCNAVRIDSALLQDAAANEDVSNPENQAAPDNAAYLLYQSGSLGPVSVCLTYRNLAAYISSFRAMFTRDECSCSLVGGRSPETVLETVAILSAGGAILCDSGADFAGPATSAPLTLMACPASTINTFINRSDVSSLRALCLSGETAGHELMKAMEQWRTKVKTGYLFGPLETARCASAYIGPVPEGRSIGDPVSGSRLYVLDRHGQPVPPGAVGDLYIGGEILARCFLGRPGLTAESFLPDRFSHQPGARLYHSGIRVRRRFNGVIEYLGEPLGRALMHGRRVFFEEIAAALKRNRAVKEAAVVVREDATDLPVIVAYVTLQASATIAESDLLTFVRTQVPRYMAPTALVILASLPLTDRGELDLKALPAFADARAEHVEFVSPRTEAERTLAAIWSNLLHVDRVSIHDDFFDLGGHSLVALQLAFRASEIFEAEVSPGDVFESPTIAEFADRMIMKKAEMVSPDALAQMLDDIEARDAPETEHHPAPER
jgi:non-ribosomal peptide synthetase component F/aryl carrier-like protein